MGPEGGFIQLYSDVVGISPPGATVVGLCHAWLQLLLAREHLRMQPNPPLALYRETHFKVDPMLFDDFKFPCVSLVKQVSLNKESWMLQ